MHCKPATVPHYRLILRKHIVPALGERLIADVEHKDILSFHNGLHHMPTVANRAADIPVKHYRVIRRYVRQPDPDRRAETSTVMVLSTRSSPRGSWNSTATSKEADRECGAPERARSHGPA